MNDDSMHTKNPPFWARVSDGRTTDLPLSGIRVIDLTRVLAGPFCTMLLGDMGAEVIKVEDPERGDDTRDWGSFVNGWSTYYLGVNRNKKSVAVDLKSAEGAALLEDLIRSADVLVETSRPGALDRLGFGAGRARALNPRLIYCSISGYGATGPRRDLPGYDMVIQGESGLMDVTGFPDTGPTKVGVAITDCLAAQYAVQGILLALNSRARTGEGQVVDPLPGWHLAIAGRGALEDPLRQFIQEAGLSSRVSLLGFRADVHDLLAAADLYVMASLSEGMPLALVEAMFAGLPIIVSGVGGIPEMVRHEQEALLVPPGDADVLAAAIRRLLTDPELGRRLGGAAGSRALKEYHADRMAAPYEALYGGSR